ncbi:hypothetical protein JOC77_001950 [Peribacillus deserti]|uniref:Calcineurin-like phosphoesterase domain-containing protein n=1 Tax=Peribacillus deserti TaxID=673318 RepID=A0ABS2QHL6_9BACI|nr:hypothetical protein [Peribacillus deserti]MBM7692520.1 hypothetical protein [Peribacillus deserti]
MKWLQLVYHSRKKYDITIFQTPLFGENKGYRQVYRLTIGGHSHQDVIKRVFSTFNVLDRLPKDFKARYIFTGDIILIDEGLRGMSYYQLQSGGWVKINRMQVC